MDWLTDWDDLIHGTAVFSAAVPFVLALALTFCVPPRSWWAVAALAVVPVTLWLFRIPKFPPTSSDDIVMIGLLAAVIVLRFEIAIKNWGTLPLRLILRAAIFAAICWSVYPAWLAADGDIGQKLLTCAGFAGSIAAVSVGVEQLGERYGPRRFSITPAALIPPTIALAVLLQTGGSIRFGQVAGAVVAGLAAICVALMLGRNREGNPEARQGKTGAFWGMMFLLLGWSGWLFAEIRYGLAALLLFAPLASALVNLIPYLPRQNPLLRMLWDAIASALVAIPLAAVAAIDYAAEKAEFEGY